MCVNLVTEINVLKKNVFCFRTFHRKKSKGDCNKASRLLRISCYQCAFLSASATRVICKSLYR